MIRNRLMTTPLLVEICLIAEKKRMLTCHAERCERAYKKIVTNLYKFGYQFSGFRPTHIIYDSGNSFVAAAIGFGLRL